MVVKSYKEIGVLHSFAAIAKLFAGYVRTAAKETNWFPFPLILMQSINSLILCSPFHRKQNKFGLFFF